MESQLNFVNFVVPKFHFEKTRVEADENVFNLEPQALISRSKNQFHINIEIEIVDKDNDFILKMLSIGMFNFNTDDEKALFSFISINGPAIIFPYIRSFISNFTSLSGFDTITLPTLNLSGFKDDLIKNMIDLDEIGDE
ncbi:protein-export chaperone SecB [Planktosalinus lacus]|uniref:Preprotein translocase subunit SecB n=1 Tax=Planktosalinus lacus TaxID=1526573 RepID=A0A8J2VBM8_9FLAO|nr:protein-export chaperone SecB [Planktosalinus lacus]GGD99020.1 hypothetical protein GCM10011312_23120 [Planktosalinus lacus]